MKIELKPFIYKFKTKNNYYIYDINLNEIFQVDEIIFEIIDYVYASEDEIISHFSQKYPKDLIIQSLKKIKKNIEEEKTFLPTHPKQLKFYDVDEVKKKLKNNLRHLILNVTEQCNLRCKYCIYSGHYYFERTHSFNRMPKEIAFKAIDFFFSNNKYSENISINFYGGEPLLNFKLIKDCVNYAKKFKRNDQKLIFSITTNGTLLKDGIVDFLIDNEIALCISLDGPKIIHDLYRVFPNGKGSFDIVVRNILNIKEKNQEYFNKNVIYNMVIVYPYDLLKIEEFIDKNKILFGRNKLNINLMVSYDNDFFKGFNRKEISESFSIQKNRLLERFIDSITTTRNSFSAYAHWFFDQSFRKIHMRKSTFPFENDFIINSICIPGQARLFIDVKGKFHICENLSSNIAIGDVTTGFNFEKIKRLIDEFLSLSSEGCCKCWAIKLCDNCFTFMTQGDKLSLVKKRKICKNNKKNLGELLIMYMTALEKNPKAFDYLISKK